MRSLLRLLTPVVLVATACSEDAPSVSARLRTPTAVTVFHGITAKRPGVVAPYLAVASAGRGEVTLFDVQDDRVVVSPGLVFPLSVPTEERPMMLAAVSLEDDGALPAERRADALVVITSPEAASDAVPVHLVSTWDGEPRVVATVTLPDLAGEVPLALIGMPVPQDGAPDADSDGVVDPVAGRARFLVSVSGGRIVVLEATRGADGSVALAVGGEVALGGATPFDAVALARSPDGRHVYAASLDLVTGTDGVAHHGVAEVDTAGDPAAWTIRALDAKLPTQGVVAARVAERLLDDPDEFVDEEITNPLARPLRVYAVLDWASCGTTRLLDCGIVTLDPATGTIAADPMGELPWRAPMTIPNAPLLIAAWDTAPAVDPMKLETADKELYGITLAPGTGVRATTALAAVPTADGRTYFLDLGRWGPALDRSMVRAPSQTRIGELGIITNMAEGGPQLGMWDDELDATQTAPALRTDAGEAAAAMKVTPGYTTNDSWSVGYQLTMPGLAARRAVLVKDGALGLVVAMQVRDGGDDANPVWRDVAPVYAPQLSVRPGDVVELALDAPPACAGQGEARVAAILPPDPVRWPGGALALSTPVEPWNNPDTTPPEDREAVWDCWTGTLPAGTYTAISVVRSGGWVLIGDRFGYAGRPQPEVRFALDYPSPVNGTYPELTLAAECPIQSWPPAGAVPACDAACRDACEQLLIVRKTRRFYYPQDNCENFGGATACAVTGRGATFDTLLPGPLVEFRFGVNPERTQETPITRPARIVWNTYSGVSEAWRAPIAGGLATGIVPYDRSDFIDDGDAGIVFYESHSGDAVYEAVFGAAATQSKTLR